jgi:8-oxo-dGTP pyrophosphatase MutT (NUDIX family)
VVVWRDNGGVREYLLLQRRLAGGVDFDGAWAWTPPSGARKPGEMVDAAAAREL